MKPTFTNPGQGSQRMKKKMSRLQTIRGSVKEKTLPMLTLMPHVHNQPPSHRRQAAIKTQDNEIRNLDKKRKDTKLSD